MEGKGEIGHGSWATRSVMGDEIKTTVLMRSVLGGSVFSGDVISVGCDWSGVMRSSVDRYGFDWSGWIGLWWGAIDLVDRSSVVM